MEVLAIIPACGESQGTPQKNAAKVAARPLNAPAWLTTLDRVTFLKSLIREKIREIRSYLDTYSEPHAISLESQLHYLNQPNEAEVG